jgi:predicted membrane protein
MQNKQRGRFIFGLILVVIGLLTILNNLDIFDVFELFDDYWPLLLVALGIHLLIKQKEKDEDEPELIPVTDAGPIDPETDSGTQKKRQSIHRIIGDITLKPEGNDLQSGSYSVLIGEIFIDMTNIEPQREPVKLYLNSTIGSVRVMLNQNIPYTIESTVLLGDATVSDKKDSGIQVKVNWENEVPGNRIELYINTLIGDVIVW